MNRLLAPASNFEDALAQSLDALRAGVAIGECLAAYPEYADGLAPLLETAMMMGAAMWPQLSPGGRARGRARMHEALERRQRRMNWLRPAWSFVGMALILAVLAAGVWLAWPGRDESRRIGRPTASPGRPELTVTATAAITATATREPTPSGPTSIGTRIPTGTNEAHEATRTATPWQTSAVTDAPAGRSETAEPTETPRPRETAKPTETPRPRETARPTETPRPRETAKPTETPRPRETARPTETPRPRETAKPTETPRPKETEEPPETPRPKETEEPKAPKGPRSP